MGDADSAEQVSGPSQTARLSPFAAADDAAASASAPAKHGPAAIARSIAIIAVTGAVALFAAAGAGYFVAQHHDAADAAQARAGLRAGAEEVRPLIRDDGSSNGRLIGLLEKSAGVTDLRFERELATTSRETQAVMNADGRIIGFLTWPLQRPLSSIMQTGAPVLVAFGLLLLALAARSVAILRRQTRERDELECGVRARDEIDPATGLPTAQEVRRRLGVALAERDIQQVVTYAVIDLDGVHDAHRSAGQTSVDEIFAAVAASLAKALPGNALLGLGHGDQFEIIIADTGDVAPVLRLALEALSRPQWLGGLVRIAGHAGYAQAPRDAVSADDLVRAARQALRAAARKGAGSVIGYDRSIAMSSKETQFIRQELPRAISAGELELHYQPIVRPDGGRINGVEALLRWTHPVRGNIPPGDFVPVAEQMGIMDTLGEFVLRRAAGDAKRWPEFYVGVNLSPVQVRGPQIVDLVRQVLAETRLDPSRLMLEITEGVLVDNPDEMIRRIEDLRALGVSIALDDFGSGYSNLGYLQRFPIDKLKIDRAFVTPLGRTANAGVIIQAIVALGRALGLKVLVEGVETEEQRVLLRMAGCDEMQGFLFARPAPVKAIDKLAAQQYAANNGSQAAAPQAVLTA